MVRVVYILCGYCRTDKTLSSPTVFRLEQSLGNRGVPEGVVKG